MTDEKPGPGDCPSCGSHDTYVLCGGCEEGFVGGDGGHEMFRKVERRIAEQDAIIDAMREGREHRVRILERQRAALVEALAALKLVSTPVAEIQNVWDAAIAAVGQALDNSTEEKTP